MQFKNLNTKLIGKNKTFYETLDSTQLEILRRIENNQIENGTIIIANKQTSGKGTHGRTWHTEKNNIAFSIFLNTNCSVEKLEGLTLKIAQILVSVFQECYGIILDIKIPNDLIFHQKKVGGILTQTKVVGKVAKCIVIGIGINTNQEKFPKELESIATSIKNEFNLTVDNTKIIEKFCYYLEQELFKKNILDR